MKNLLALCKWSIVAMTALAGVSAFAQQDSTRGTPRWAINQFALPAPAAPAAVESMADWFTRNNGRTLTVMGLDLINGPMAQREVKDAPVFAHADIAMITMTVSGSSIQVQHTVYRPTGGAPTDYSNGLQWNGAPTLLGWKTNFILTQSQLEALGGAGILARDNTSGNLAWRLIGIPFYGNPVVLGTDTYGAPQWQATASTAPHGAPVISYDAATVPIDQMTFVNTTSAYSCPDVGYPIGSGNCPTGVPIEFAHAVGIAATYGIPAGRVLAFDRIFYYTASNGSGIGAGDP